MLLVLLQCLEQNFRNMPRRLRSVLGTWYDNGAIQGFGYLDLPCLPINVAPSQRQKLTDPDGCEGQTQKESGPGLGNLPQYCADFLRRPCGFLLWFMIGTVKFLSHWAPFNQITLFRHREHRA